MMRLKDRAVDLFSLIETGKTIEAMEKYYDEEVIMQENDDKPRIGRLINITNEIENQNRIKEVKAKLKSYSINEETNTVFSEWEFRFRNKNGIMVMLEEVSVQHWSTDKIVHERFYYHDFKQIDSA